MQRIRVRTKARLHQYEITVGSGTLVSVGAVARNCLDQARRVAVISNQPVFDLYGARLTRSLRASGFGTFHWLMGDGERFKSLRSVARALSFLHESGLERNDAVLALGGGVVGDVAGFAAASYLRGIRYIQVPTTLMSQIDSSVGGKTGVNLPLGKNLAGAFHQPSAVVIDIETLQTLPNRELVAGWCEGVKQGAVGDRSLFERTTGYLRRFPSGRGTLASEELKKLIAAQCVFKASIVTGDERETIGRTDHRSRRMLNFGHTVGHALEAVTRYRRYRHGEAVGHGMLVAGTLAKSLGLLNASELELLREGVHLCGPLPKAHDLDVSAIMNLLARDKKSVRGRIQWVLLERIGKARIVDGSEITPGLLRASLRTGLARA